MRMQIKRMESTCRMAAHVFHIIKRDNRCGDKGDEGSRRQAISVDI